MSIKLSTGGCCSVLCMKNAVFILVRLLRGAFDDTSRFISMFSFSSKHTSFFISLSVFIVGEKSQTLSTIEVSRYEGDDV
jgi:hypothetical protein